MTEKDPRLKKLETEIEAERNLGASSLAFSGFGRSTNTATTIAKIEKQGQARIALLSQIIGLEEQLKKSYDEDAAERLGELYSAFSELASQAAKRRADVGTKLAGLGQKANIELKAKLRLGANRIKPRRTKKFVSGKPKPLTSRKPTILPSRRTKTYSGIQKQRPISAIVASNRSKSFGSKTTIAGKKA